jgi:hypothetical protein
MFDATTEILLVNSSGIQMYFVSCCRLFQFGTGIADNIYARSEQKFAEI